MIGRLSGQLLVRQPPQLLLDVNGVGYEIEAPMSTFYALPEIGSKVTLHTHLVVREDAHTLFGFATENERAMFRALIKVNGVGARLGLTILSGISADDFIRCVTDGDAASLTRLPGVGKKTAERLIVEMKDVLKKWQAEAGDSGAGVSPATALARPDDAVADAVSALIALGYKPPEASRMVRGIETRDMSSEGIIRLALQSTAK
ncbi:Holliday junction branch migration protein RuvA [Sulfuriflexus sp.]|uniref:Holliday junction branch migration protein RuvA n=1 Tax=Sulfuriflexus sp. TaxID=2015443 RepID=UPI0028CBC50E|nr:Holliday junction branch migration protein RuvA [Sulfuriflexus sp.]MDT8404256.1 Holliday junction branch migration protein RuvA [Sulfuriflexus sp.]